MSASQLPYVRLAHRIPYRVLAPRALFPAALARDPMGYTPWLWARPRTRYCRVSFAVAQLWRNHGDVTVARRRCWSAALLGRHRSGHCQHRRSRSRRATAGMTSERHERFGLRWRAKNGAVTASTERAPDLPALRGALYGGLSTDPRGRGRTVRGVPPAVL